MVLTCRNKHSSYITFTLRQGHCPAVNINEISYLNRSSKIPRTTLLLQVKLERTHRQKKKTNRLKNKIDQLVDRKKKSHLSVENKLRVYKVAIKPIWSYGIELWGCASKSNVVIMQRSQSKILRAITNSPWC